MKWSDEADQAIRQVPFFVRKKVRSRVEEYSRSNDHSTVTLADVKTVQQQFLHKMSKEIKGFQIDSCFGPNGCPNRAMIDDTLLSRLEASLEQADLLGFLKTHVRGELKFHHEFRVTLADCPNACSQPQIKDVGIIGAGRPRLTDQECTACEACVDTCREAAVTLSDDGPPVIDMRRCVACGQCISACPSGTIAAGEKGYRVLLGGKLGRHPRLALEMPGLYAADAVVAVVERCLDWYKVHSKHGERFGELLSEAHADRLAAEFAHLRLDRS